MLATVFSVPSNRPCVWVEGDGATPPIAPKWNAVAKTLNVIAAVKRCTLMSVRLNPPLASQNNGAPSAIAMFILLKISRYLMSV